MLAAAVAAISISTTRAVGAEERAAAGGNSAVSAPAYGLWAGTRIGVLVPFGALYSDSRLVTTPFADLATAGPAMEFDVGGRFARRFVGYALLDLAYLGRGTSAAWTQPHGGQESPSTQALGLGLRWESNPEGLGVVADAAIAHRWFTARWEDATTVQMNGPFDVRFGIGASWRIAPIFTLAPMMTVSSGAFSNRTVSGQELGLSAGAYSIVTFLLSGHFDII